MAGLSAAFELTAAPGLDVVLLEGSGRLGGTLRQASVAGLPVDVGAESALAARPELVDLVTEAGLADRLTAPATTTASIWSRGALRPMPTGTVMGIPADAASATGILDAREVERLADERPYPLPTGADDVAVGEYVAARLGDAVVDRLVEPLLGGVYAGDSRRLSLRSATPQLWSAVRSGDSLLASVARARAADGTTRAGSAFMGLTGGLGSLPGALAGVITRRGATVRTRTMVRDVRRRADGRWVVVAGPTIAEQEIDADGVILAVPSAPAARLLRLLAPSAAAALAGVETASMAIITVAVDAAALGDVPGSGFLVPPVEGWTIKASTFSSAKWAWLAEAGGDTAYLRASVGRAGAVVALQQPDEALIRVAVSEIGRGLGRPLPPLLDAHVQRWGGGLPQYAVGHLARMAIVREAVSALPGLEVAGATYEGVGIPAVVGTGRRAAATALAHLAQPIR